MRVAILVIGLAVSVFFFFQTQEITRLGTLGAAFGSQEAADAVTAASTGSIAALIGGIASGLVLRTALLSSVFFLLAGISGFAASEGYPDAGVWGWVYIILMVFSFFMWLGHRRGVRRQKREKAKIEA